MDKYRFNPQASFSILRQLKIYFSKLCDVTEILFIRNRLISDHPGRKFSGKSAFI